MNGKGDSDRTSDFKKYGENLETIFRPKEPFDSDAKKHEEAYLIGKGSKIADAWVNGEPKYY